MFKKQEQAMAQSQTRAGSITGSFAAMPPASPAPPPPRSQPMPIAASAAPQKKSKGGMLSRALDAVPGAFDRGGAGAGHGGNHATGSPPAEARAHKSMEL